MSDANMNAVPSNLLEGLSKLGSSVVGLSAFAYIAGFVKLKSMYASINAEWIIEFVTTQDIIKAGLEPLAMVGVAGAATGYILTSKSWVTLKLLTFLLLSVFLLFTTFVTCDGLAKGWSESFRFSEFIAYCLYVFSGMLISFSVFKMTLSIKLYKLPTAAFMVGTLISLYVTPVYLGKIWANSIVRGETKLARAIGDQYRSDVCYLLGNVNSKYLIGCIFSEKIKRVQLVDVGKDIAFE